MKQLNEITNPALRAALEELAIFNKYGDAMRAGDSLFIRGRSFEHNIGRLRQFIARANRWAADIEAIEPKSQINAEMVDSIRGTAARYQKIVDETQAYFDRRDRNCYALAVVVVSAMFLAPVLLVACLAGGLL